MHLTNRQNLPEPLVIALSGDDYERGAAEFTTTELIRPVRIQSLTRKHWNEMEEDVSDRLWAMMGQVKHTLLERIAKENPDRYLIEQRLEATIPGDRKISGKIDLFDLETSILYDFKETSIWKFMIGDTEEWEQQANINLYLLRRNGVTGLGLKNIALLKDWKARLARTTKKKDYPQQAINVVDLLIWTQKAQEEFIQKRIEAFDKGREDPPVCTSKERWERARVFALMKKGRKRAIKKCESQQQALAVLDDYVKRSQPGEKFFIEERPVEPVRCLDFCGVWQYCDFGKQAREQWREDTSD